MRNAPALGSGSGRQHAMYNWSSELGARGGRCSSALHHYTAAVKTQRRSP
jgi:hypothetical protein